MSYLLVGFYGEGQRDSGFLMPLLQRVIASRLPHMDIDIEEIEVKESRLSQKDAIVRAAEQTIGWNLLIIHLDADDSTPDRAYAERFLPGYEQVKNLYPEHDLIPVIPIYMTEAWMLVDGEAFHRSVPTRIDPKKLNFPQSAAAVEEIKNPKEVFEEAVRLASSGRRGRLLSPADVYIQLVEQIDLSRLEQVPAFHTFLARLDDFLTENHYIK